MHFNIKEIPNIIAKQMKAKGVWKTDCPVNLKHLKLLEISHIDFEGNIRSGEIIVLDKLAESVIRIFKELMVKK